MHSPAVALAMFRNYFITALRNFQRNKAQAFIQLISLAVGIIAAIFIGLYVQHEYSYDQFNERIDRIYRLEFGNQVSLWNAIGTQISQEIPEVEKVVRLVNWSGKDRVFTSNYSPSDDSLEVRFIEIGNQYWCDSTLFDVFSIELIQGDVATALKIPGNGIISESAAKRVFGDQDPLGEQFWGGGLTIAGVFRDLPNSHIDLDLLISMVSFENMGGAARGEPGYLNNYGGGSSWMTYVLLEEGVDPSYLEERIDAFFKEKWKNTFEYEAINSFHLRPLREIYLSNGLDGEFNTFNHGNRDLLRVLMATAFFVLILGIINYMNLTTARATLRAREVGIRKVTGASARRLFLQFQVEAVLLTLFSFLLGILMLILFLPGFRRLTGADLNIQFLEIPGTWLIILALVLLLGFFSGAYPSLYMTRFRPVESLAGKQFTGRGSMVFRRILLTLQFTISIILIIGVLVISKQISYMQSTDPGFNMENVVTITGGNHLWQMDPAPRKLIRERLLQFPDILQVAFTSGMTGDEQNMSAEPYRMNGIEKHAAWLGIDPGYLDLMEIGIQLGRDFDRELPGDYIPDRGDGMPRILVNETFVREFELEHTGAQIITWENGFEQEIIGIVSDFHFSSLHDKIPPTMLGWANFLPWLTVKVSPGSTQATIARIQTELSGLLPELDPDFFKYSFLDENYAAQYDNDKRTGRIILIFAIVAILLACLGLFGLALFMAARRVKEIGIRKSFGASVRSLFILLATEYLRWIMVSVILACPAAWFIMNKWLESFAYRTGISWWVFALAILFAVLITFATVSWQSRKTARTNPVESLRYE